MNLLFNFGVIRYSKKLIYFLLEWISIQAIHKISIVFLSFNASFSPRWPKIESSILMCVGVEKYITKWLEKHSSLVSDRPGPIKRISGRSNRLMGLKEINI